MILTKFVSVIIFAALISQILKSKFM